MINLWDNIRVFGGFLGGLVVVVVLVEFVVVLGLDIGGLIC